MKRFNDKYVILSRIGQGGNGVVLKAFHLNTHTLVAIKSIPKIKIDFASEICPRDDLKKTVPIEAFVMMTCKHPGIISLFSCLEDDSNWYFVMDLPSSPWQQKVPKIDTPTIVTETREKVQIQALESLDALKTDKPIDLFEVIEDGFPLPTNRIKSIFKQIVEAVMYLHSKDIIHGDIKDENVIIDSNDEIKLIDFGSSYFAKPGEKVLVKSGTVQYLSPEVLESIPCDPRKVDVWCLGIILYVMVYGKLPFSSKLETCNLDLFEAKTPQDHLIESLLMKDPQKRISITKILSHEWFNETVPIYFQSDVINLK